MQRMRRLFHLPSSFNKKPTTSINGDAEPLPAISPGNPDLLTVNSDEEKRQQADDQWQNHITNQRPSLAATVQQAEELAGTQHVFTKVSRPKTRSIFCCFTACCRKNEDNEETPLVGLKR